MQGVEYLRIIRDKVECSSVPLQDENSLDNVRNAKEK